MKEEKEYQHKYSLKHSTIFSFNPLVSCVFNNTDPHPSNPANNNSKKHTIVDITDIVNVYHIHIYIKLIHEYVY